MNPTTGSNRLLEQLSYPPCAGDNADKLALLASVRAMECRASQAASSRWPEIHALLQGAIDVGLLDATKGQLLLDQARHVHADAALLRSRLAFAAGAVLGSILVLVAIGLMIFGKDKLAWMSNLADPSMLFSLCSFALIGSLISIFSRLPKMELKDTDSPLFLALSAAIQPMIALGFTAVVYVLLSYQVLGFKITATSTDAVMWVAAFLCGFSERFAPGIVGTASALFVKPRAQH
jgi:hypothetical protein